MAGNRLSKTDPNGTVNYVYAAANRLSSDSTYTYSYDNTGNLLTKKQSGSTLDTYTWDRANRLLSLASGGTTTSYAYDGNGQRIQQTVGANTTTYLNDVQRGQWQVLSATQSSSTTRYAHGPMGLLAQQNPDTTWRWPVLDGLGSVRAVVDSGVAPQESRQYSPFGEVYNTTGSGQTMYGFTGEPTDANGLVQLRARYYSPNLGVFPSMDPLEDDAGQGLSLNRYSYVTGNPVNRTDPSGLCPADPGPLDFFGWDCLLLVKILHERYGWDEQMLAQHSDGELQAALQTGELSDLYQSSPFLQTLHDNPIPTLLIGIGAVALLPVVAAGGAAVALGVIVGALVGSYAGSFLGAAYGSALYYAGDNCDTATKSRLQAMGYVAFVNAAKTQGALYGFAFGLVGGIGGVPAFAGGVASTALGVNGILATIDDVDANGGKANTCDIINGILSFAALAGGIAGMHGAIDQVSTVNRMPKAIPPKPQQGGGGGVGPLTRLNVSDIRFTQQYYDPRPAPILDPITGKGIGEYTVESNAQFLRDNPDLDLPSSIKVFTKTEEMNDWSPKSKYGYTGYPKNLQDGEIYTLDNRRLQSYKLTGRTTIPVEVIYDASSRDSQVYSQRWKFQTLNFGVSIEPKPDTPDN